MLLPKLLSQLQRLGVIFRFSFLFSMAFKASIPSIDRLKGWGLNVPSDCLICASHQKNRQHIFLVAHIPLRFDISSRPNSISAVIQASKVHQHIQIVLQGARNRLSRSAVFVMNTTELINCSLAVCTP